MYQVYEKLKSERFHVNMNMLYTQHTTGIYQVLECIPEIYLVYTLSKRVRDWYQKDLEMFERYIPGIYFTSSYTRFILFLYLVYTWYILFMYSIYLVYTGYMTLCCHISGMYLIYDSNIAYSCLHRTCHSSSMSYIWYIPQISLVYVHFQIICMAPAGKDAFYFKGYYYFTD